VFCLCSRCFQWEFVLWEKKKLLNKKVLWRKMLNEYKIFSVVRYHQLNKKSAKWDTQHRNLVYGGKHLNKKLWSRRQLNKKLWSRLRCIWICELRGFLWKSNNYIIVHCSSSISYFLRFSWIGGGVRWVGSTMSHPVISRVTPSKVMLRNLRAGVTHLAPNHPHFSRSSILMPSHTHP
jgi:hypothetical protein